MIRPALSIDLQGRTAPSDWRRLPNLEHGEILDTLFIRRFTSTSVGPEEKIATCPSDFYTLGVNLQRTKVTAFVNGRQVFSGDAQPGYIHIAHPGDKLRFINSNKLDVCHMFCPAPVLEALLVESELDSGSSGKDLLERADFMQDRKLFGLFHALIGASTKETSLTQLYTQGLSLAVVSALLSGYSERAGSLEKIRRHGLTGWQLKLVQDFVDANIAEPVSLRAMASVLGLSRMHFAAQFLQSTGLRPHEYLLQERIRRAQQLLTDTQLSIIEIALAVGFETQSHFSTVFKRFVGSSPARWRGDVRS